MFSFLFRPVKSFCVKRLTVAATHLEKDYDYHDSAEFSVCTNPTPKQGKPVVPSRLRFAFSGGG